jgi:hypothetical protein
VSVLENPDRFASIREQALSVERAISASSSDRNLDRFRDGLEVLLDTATREANLSRSGGERLEMLCRRLLRNRVQIAAALDSFPEITQTPIVKPLIVVGFYRSGTTFLHHLLAQDPRAHAPLMWELSAPAPPPALNSPGNDLRIKGAEQAALDHRRSRPEIDSIHPLSANNPEECSLLLQTSFSSTLFFLNLNVPSYLKWLLNRDMQAAYQYYFKQLQIILWRSKAEHVVLKAPEHLLFLDSLMTVFPDACVVHLHRNLASVVGSSCSLIRSLRRLSVDEADWSELGRQTIDLLTQMASRSTDFRRSTDRRFYDLQYDRLIEAPVHTVREIYQYFGYDYGAEFELSLTKFVAQNHQNRENAHSYSLEEYGLTERSTHRFSEYTEWRSATG